MVLEYLVTNKTAANGAKNFQTTATISGVTDVTTTTMSVASGGQNQESIQSIKLNAPLDYALKVVRLPQKITRQSFQRYTQIQSRYKFGVVKITRLLSLVVLIFQSFQPLVLLLHLQKEQIVKDLKNEYTIASVTPVIVDPVTTFVRLGVTFKYNKKNTTKASETLISNVTETLQIMIPTIYKSLMGCLDTHKLQD